MRQSNVVAVAAVAAALAAATATVSAQAKPEVQAKPAAPQLAPGLPAKPYLQLFDQQSDAARRSQMRSNFMRPNSARRFICHITVFPADSAVDPKFAMRPRDTTTRFSMRVVAPGQCH